MQIDEIVQMLQRGELQSALLFPAISPLIENHHNKRRVLS